MLGKKKTEWDKYTEDAINQLVRIAVHNLAHCWPNANSNETKDKMSERHIRELADGVASIVWYNAKNTFEKQDNRSYVEQVFGSWPHNFYSTSKTIEISKEKIFDLIDEYMEKMGYDGVLEDLIKEKNDGE